MKENFESQLDLTPCDFTLRAVYADWLEENGFYDISFVQRWMIKREISPFNRSLTKKKRVVKPQYKWAWYPQRNIYYRDKPISIQEREVFKGVDGTLPDLIFNNLPRCSDMHNNKLYPTRKEAEDSLLESLIKFKALLSI